MKCPNQAIEMMQRHWLSLAYFMALPPEHVSGCFHGPQIPLTNI